MSGPGKSRSTNGLKWENVHSVVASQIGADGTHIWPFNASFPIDVRAFAFSKLGAIRMTRHDYFELLYVYSGQAQYQVQDSYFRVGEKDLIVINGAFYHRLSEVLTTPFKAIVLYFLPDVIRATNTLGEDAQYLMPFLLQDAKFPHIIPRRTGIPEEVLNLILKIQTNLPATTDRARLVARTYLKMALVQLILHYEGQLGTTRVFSRRERARERLQPVFDYLDSHYPEPIALGKTAALLGMSKSHFMRFFKKVTGQSFVKYLNHFRIAKALGLLASTDKPISEVSQDVGFCDQSYFGLIFHRILRMTPRDYRKSFVVPE